VLLDMPRHGGMSKHLRHVKTFPRACKNILQTSVGFTLKGGTCLTSTGLILTSWKTVKPLEKKDPRLGNLGKILGERYNKILGASIFSYLIMQLT